MCDAFFHLNFLNVRGILAQKNLYVRDDPNNQVSSVSCLPVSPSTPELATLRKANLIFQ